MVATVVKKNTMRRMPMMMFNSIWEMAMDTAPTLHKNLMVLESRKTGEIRLLSFFFLLLTYTAFCTSISPRFREKDGYLVV